MSNARSRVIDDIMQKVPASAGQDDQIPDSIKEERQARLHPAMLVVISKNGDEDLLAYPLFRRALKRDGGRVWELVFDDCTVRITGRNLGEKLRDMLRLQRLSILREGNLIEDELTPDDKAFIESIHITPKEDL
jgi:hypothetical protein